MGRLAGVALTTASIMLIIVAIPLNSAALFYMSTAMIALMVAARIQAALAIRGLRVERVVPDIVRVAEPIRVDLTLWTDTRVKRPLIMLLDHFPEGMVVAELTPTLPIAPVFGHPIQTHYSFRAMRRGKYRWNKVTAMGTDALGLVAKTTIYEATPATLTVLPSPIPVAFDLTSTSGWGFAETEHGRGRGLGIQPRGVREYVPGDALRYVHWRSTARTGQLLVKEFETGAQAGVSFYLQTSVGTDIGRGAKTTLEHMCSNLAYLCGWLLRQGIEVSLPILEVDPPAGHPTERENQILMLLAEVQADSPRSLGATVLESARGLEQGTHICVLVAVSDPMLPAAIGECIALGHPVSALVYDAAAYPRGKIAKPVQSASQTEFVAQLRASGASVTFVNVGGELL